VATTGIKALGATNPVTLASGLFLDIGITLAGEFFADDPSFKVEQEYGVDEDSPVHASTTLFQVNTPVGEPASFECDIEVFEYTDPGSGVWGSQQIDIELPALPRHETLPERDVGRALNEIRRGELTIADTSFDTSVVGSSPEVRETDSAWTLRNPSWWNPADEQLGFAIDQPSGGERIVESEDLTVTVRGTGVSDLANHQYSLGYWDADNADTFESYPYQVTESTPFLTIPADELRPGDLEIAVFVESVYGLTDADSVTATIQEAKSGSGGNGGGADNSDSASGDGGSTGDGSRNSNGTSVEFDDETAGDTNGDGEVGVDEVGPGFTPVATLVAGGGYLAHRLLVANDDE
jgi:hypothetical protein